MAHFPDHVKIVEVGPRDGLQDEPHDVPTALKVEFIDMLTKCGLETIEVTSFVSPKWVPKLADAAEVYSAIQKKEGIHYPVLVPNMKGFERAVEVGAREISIFTAASETFNQRNINCSIAESIKRFEPVVQAAREKEMLVRGYISCTLGCPYEGEIDINNVAAVAEELWMLGCYEMSLGDTIGVGTPVLARRMVSACANRVPMKSLAIHFHDTRAQALANILACLEMGMHVVDSSVSGLGGCPYADGAAGNIATEDVVYMLHGMGIHTGVDLKKLLEVAQFINGKLGRTPTSKLARLPVEKALDATKH